LRPVLSIKNLFPLRDWQHFPKGFDIIRIDLAVSAIWLLPAVVSRYLVLRPFSLKLASGYGISPTVWG